MKRVRIVVVAVVCESTCFHMYNILTIPEQTADKELSSHLLQERSHSVTLLSNQILYTFVDCLVRCIEHQSSSLEV